MLRRKRRGAVVGRRLFLEGLEQRSMLAGNVFVSVSGSTLKITGDDHPNAIVITQLDDGAYAVAGFNGTRVNGFDDPPVFITGKKIINIEADMRRGDDICAVGTDVQALADIAAFYGVPVDPDSIQDLIDFVADEGIVLNDDFFLKGNLKVKMNDGVDAFALSDGDIHGSVEVDGGKHSDLTVIHNTFIGDDLKILNSTEKGNVGHADLVEITDCFVHDNVSVKTGDGNDTVLITNVGLSTLDVDTGDREDVVNINFVARNDDPDPAKKVNITTGAWRDIVTMANVLAKDICVDTGSGNDDLEMNDVFATHDLVVKTGSGLDNLFIGLNSEDGVGAEHSVKIDTGSGHDFAEIDNFFGGKWLEILMGDGDDLLIFNGFGGKALLDGGKGFNLLDLEGDDFHEIKIKHFFFDDIDGDDDEGEGGGGGVEGGGA